MASAGDKTAVVNTVLGPVAADALGVTLVHEGLLSIVPGAQYAFDIQIDRAEIFETLKQRLNEFKNAGGSTIVDSLGMFHGRDVPLYEALSRATGVNIIASTGMGPEEQLGGYFLTPQTNPPTPWPAEKFADLFSKEVTEGMVVPRLERRNGAGLAVTAADRTGITATEGSLFRGVARTAQTTGVPASIQFGTDAVGELQIVLDEGLTADRVVVAGLDRKSAVAAGAPAAVAQLGANVAIDHVGTNTSADFITDAERVTLISELVAAGFADRIFISASATGVSKGEPGISTPYAQVLTGFVPLLKQAGIAESVIDQILIHNPARLLTTAATK
jgi:phosphotriesterase-related protein